MATAVQFSVEAVKDEVRDLIHQGLINRRRPIYTLCEYLPNREWVCMKLELEKQDFLPEDAIGDLLGPDQWDED